MERERKGVWDISGFAAGIFWFCVFCFVDLLYSRGLRELEFVHGELRYQKDEGILLC
jgi:hypothetical protein